jgi:hypothetical protein
VSCVIINRIRVFIIVFIIYIGQDTNGEREDVSQRTNNIMVKRKRTKGQTMIYNTLHRKLKNMSTLNVVRIGLMLMGLILNVSGRPCIIGGCNDNDHMSNTL